MIGIKAFQSIFVKTFNENRGSFLKIKAKRGRPRLPFLTTHRAEPVNYGGFADACQS